MRRLSVFLLLMAVACPVGWAQKVQEGLAARFPNDAGIERHPAVIFASGFENGFGGWSYHNPRVSAVVNDPRLVHSGAACCRTVATRGRDTGGDVTFNFPRGVDQVYVRFYCRFDKDSVMPHHFVKIQAIHDYQPNAGTKPPGDKAFWTGIEPRSDRTWNFYTYWYEMRTWKPNPTGTSNDYYGNTFRPEGQAPLPMDTWICVEAMLKSNTVGRSDGEQAFWIDGRLMGWWKPGTPAGTWVRDHFDTAGPYNPNPRPFEGFDFRSSPAVTINQVALQWYISDRVAGRGRADRNIVYFDDVVIATQYIGPMTAKGSGRSPGSTGGVTPPPGWTPGER